MITYNFSFPGEGTSWRKKTRGRPAKPEAEKRRPRFVVKLTDEENYLIRNAAGDKLSTWAREVLLLAAKRKR